MNSALVLIVLSGCAVVPVTTQSSQLVGPVTPGAETSEPAGPLQIQLDASSANAVVTATWPRKCVRVYMQKLQTTERMHSELATGGAEGLDALPATAFVLVGPALVAVLGVSAIITGITVASHQDKVTYSERAVDAQVYSCTKQARGIAVRLLLPSGAHLDGVTNEQGAAKFAIPDDEPSGQLVASIGNAHSPPVAYTAD